MECCHGFLLQVVWSPECLQHGKLYYSMVAVWDDGNMGNEGNMEGIEQYGGMIVIWRDESNMEG